MTEDSLDDPFDVWFAPRIDPKALRQLMHRTNAHGLLNLALWLLLCAATGSVVWLARHTLWVWPAMILYGSVLGFAYAASHECAHGTAFRSRSLNEAVFWLTSLLFMEEPLYRRYSHAGHHTHTWFNATDPQKPYGNPISLSRYLVYTSGLCLYSDVARQLLRHGVSRFTEIERAFLPAAELRRVSMHSRVMLGLYLGLGACGIMLGTAAPFLLFFIPRFLGGWVVTCYVNTQHMCMAEDLHDHRCTTRSIRCNAIERVLYWNMNHHIEHHLYPSVPFHALPSLSREIGSQIPPPAGGVIAVNQQILRAIALQRRNPNFNLSPIR